MKLLDGTPHDLTIACTRCKWSKVLVVTFNHKPVNTNQQSPEKHKRWR